jgi:2-iminobutanoate/2-iminopropanoate deaminase
MARQRIETIGAPAPLGPYSQGIAASGWVFPAGQIGIIPETGELAAGGAAAEAEQVMQNLGAILAAGGSGFDRVVKATLILADISDFAAVNSVYARSFPVDAPARSVIGGVQLPRGARVEIEVIAQAGKLG